MKTHGKTGGERGGRERGRKGLVPAARPLPIDLFEPPEVIDPLVAPTAPRTVGERAAAWLAGDDHTLTTDLREILYSSGILRRPLPWWAGLDRCPECAVYLPCGLRPIEVGGCCPDCGCYWASADALARAVYVRPLAWPYRKGGHR